MNQHCLLFDPFPVKLITPVFKFFTFSDQVNQLVLLRILAFIICFAHQLIMKFVKPSNLMLLLLVDIVALLYLYLISNDQILFVILLSKSFFFLFGKKLNLTFCIQLINFDPCYLVHNVFQLHFLFLDFIAYFLSLFQQIRSSFLYCCVLTLLVD